MTEEVVKLEDVWLRYDGTPVLEGVNLSLYRDDFLGIIGPNGGGKTTLFRVMLGLVKPGRGSVTILGETPEGGRRHVGYLPQHSLFDPDFPASVMEVVLMGRLGNAGLFRRYGRDDKGAAVRVLETVGMTDYRDRQIGKLSGGQQQRAFLARALVSEPQILLLDEPMANVDTPMQAGFYELLESLKHKMTIIMVSHDVSVVSACVDKIACLNRRLYYHGTGELTKHDIEEAYQCPVELIAHGVPHRVFEEHIDR
ncbi:MAG: ABC transporter ATP-binding protein [Chloroflexota bacterium]|nr:ABC transporter ATP-binding protein [Chloroflexota bacterium]